MWSSVPETAAGPLLQPMLAPAMITCQVLAVHGFAVAIWPTSAAYSAASYSVVL
jgi:hypothetical protein